jgi:hypothetical protein
MASLMKSVLNGHKRTHYQLYMRLTRVVKETSGSYLKPERARVYCTKTIDPAFIQSETFELAQKLIAKMGKVVKTKKVKSEPSTIVS